MIEFRLLLKKRKEGTDVQGLAYHGDANGCVTHEAVLQFRLLKNTEDPRFVQYWGKWQDVTVVHDELS